MPFILRRWAEHHDGVDGNQPVLVADGEFQVWVHPRLADRSFGGALRWATRDEAQAVAAGLVGYSEVVEVDGHAVTRDRSRLEQFHDGAVYRRVPLSVVSRVTGVFKGTRE